LCASIYHENPAGIKQVADVIGAEVLASSIHLDEYQPDYTILWDKATCLVVMDGTTNFAQWIGHAASAVSPIIDNVIDEPVIASFFLGLTEVEGTINQVILPLKPKQVIVCGHSYGGACAFIFARHREFLFPDIPIYVTTFGEPKSYTAGLKGNLPDQHLRLVAWKPTSNLLFEGTSQYDPVTYMPPGQLEFFGFGKLFTFAKIVAALTPAHQGDEYLLQANGSLTYNTRSFLLSLPFVELAAAADTLEYFALHFMDQSYLAKCQAAWEGTQ